MRIGWQWLVQRLRKGILNNWELYFTRRVYVIQLEQYASHLCWRTS